jgi:hypothetical protein
MLPYLMPGIKGTVVEVASGVSHVIVVWCSWVIGTELEILWNGQILGPTPRFEVISARHCFLFN